MPVVVQCAQLPLEVAVVDRLWREVIKARRAPDEEVALRCVAEEEMAELNQRYRDKAGPTNVLTFSYPATAEQQKTEHDVAICLAVVEREARDGARSLEDYLAWVITHALLHVTGMDHEESAAAEQAMQELEQQILATVLH